MFKVFGVFAVLFSSQISFAAPTGLTDAEAAKVLITINEGEIDAGKLAMKKAQNAEVKSFAKMMVDEHTKNAAETKTLAKDNEIKPADSDMSKAQMADNKAMEKDLKSKDKKSFDKAYTQGMVAGHEKALKALDEQLIPASKDPEFKGHLAKTRAAVEAHLGHAKDLDSKIQ